MEASLSLLLLTTLPFFIPLPSTEANANQQVTAMFVFGDSLSDPGNNIYFIATAAKTKFWPYGVDFEKGPTGRFSNGKIFVDYIGEMLGLPIVTSYADSVAKGDDITSGVNYASAGSGILDDTGHHFGRVIPLREQIENFKNTLEQLRGQMQMDELSRFLAKAVVIVNMGANDYLNNYNLPALYKSSLIYSPQEYADFLVKLYTGYIQEMQNLGLRKFLITSVAPIGCIPAILSLGLTPPGECETRSNILVQMFNSRLKPLVYRLNSNNPGSVFMVAAAFDIFMDLRNNAESYGFTIKDKACCGIGMSKSKPFCLPNMEPCYNRDEYLFWDGAHPTEAASRNMAERIFNSSTYCYPVTIQELAEM